MHAGHHIDSYFNIIWLMIVRFFSLKEVLLVCLLVSVSACNPSGGETTPRTGRRAGGLAGDSDGHSSGISSGNQHNKYGHSQYSENGLKNSDKHELKKMPLGEVMLLKKEREQQDKREEAELKLLDAMNTRLCQKLRDKRENCPAMQRIIYDPHASEGLRCSSSESQAGDKAKIEVSIPASIFGPFILIVNDVYRSTPFGAGTTEIKFSSAGADILAPQLMKVFSIKIRSANEEIPQLAIYENFPLKILIGGEVLVDELILTSDHESHHAGKGEYSINIRDITAMRMSSQCRVDYAQIEELKQKIKNSITQGQAVKEKEEYIREMVGPSGITDHAKARNDLITEIIKLREKIAARFNLLENERNRQFKLTNELKTDMHIGCQIHQPIRSFEMELEGSINDRVYLGKQEHKKPDRLYDGNTHEILFNFGGIKFTVDFSKKNIFGVKYRYEQDISDQELIGSLDRILIRKKGVSYDNVLVPCEKDEGLINSFTKIFHSKSCYDVYEEGSISISSMILYVNGKKAYSNNGLSLLLNREHFKFSADLRSDEQWLRLMLDDNCSVTN